MFGKVEHLIAYLESRISHTMMHHSGRNVFLSRDELVAFLQYYPQMSIHAIKVCIFIVKFMEFPPCERSHKSGKKSQNFSFTSSALFGGIATVMLSCQPLLRVSVNYTNGVNAVNVT